MERASVLFSTCYIGRYKQLTYLRHVETGVFFADVLDDQFPLTGADVLDRNARIVRHHNQVDGLDGFGVGFHPTDLLSSVHRPDNSPPNIQPTPHRRNKRNKNRRKTKENRIRPKGHPFSPVLLPKKKNKMSNVPHRAAAHD